ncbi:MAG: hypothetical protein OEV61_02060 [Chloroflexota bacterium]|jgi:hypothetical protein|nr:hypothetical protein [Chloroflexota bacterium]MDH5242326.1 hypothetical protein [Chloroflexota bacterium]
MTTIDVRCHRVGDGWRCEAAVDDGRTSGLHAVTIPDPDAARLAPTLDQAGVERLVEATFAFLLEREPRSSILASFDPAVVRRYFPEYDAEVARRLST